MTDEPPDTLPDVTTTTVTSLPAVLAQRQLDAYNAWDIDAFVACYSDDVEVFDLPSMQLVLTGRDALRARYAPYFLYQRPHAVLTDARLVLGSMAIDPEFVRRADGSEGTAIALYHVDSAPGQGGLIRRVWFIRG